MIDLVLSRICNLYFPWSSSSIVARFLRMSDSCDIFELTLDICKRAFSNLSLKSWTVSAR